ncbi:MAG: DUF547 domain-containing protein [Casimicrobiaceae bacterium]
MLFSPRFSRARRPSRLAAWRPFLTGVGVALALLFVVGLALAQPVDQAPFDALLRANVKAGAVNYPGFQDSTAFARYVQALGKPARLDGRAEMLAYYINAYNALAIQGILEGLSPSSLLGRARYFKFKEWPLNGRSVTLEDLEHKILRPLSEPRMHFAIVCASQSCPLLRAEAYTAGMLEAQLDEQARQFVNDPSRNRFDNAGRTANLSPIFNWFGEDFRGAAGSVQKYVGRYAADKEVALGLGSDAFKVEWLDYDWRLNGTPPRR